MSNRATSHKLILASASPRRALLLSEAGYSFDVVKSSLEEPTDLSPELSPCEVAEAISYFKARDVAADAPDAIILAADTLVALGNEIFGKPRDRSDARRILTELLGTTHEVITGVTVLPSANPADRIITHNVTRVRMRRMSDSELERYLDSGDWQGKAGAFGIQDKGDPFVECVEGSFTNVVGLPMELVAEILRRVGVTPR